MLKIPRRYAHFLYGGIQSGITSGVASGIGSLGYLSEDPFLTRWLQAWLTSWTLMIPVVLFAAPFIRRLTYSMTSEDGK
jgi:hypothetical protein